MPINDKLYSICNYKLDKFKKSIDKLEDINIELHNENLLIKLVKCNTDNIQEKIIYLIEKGININYINSDGQNALFLTPNEKILELLIDNEIDINHLDINDRNFLFNYMYYQISYVNNNPRTRSITKFISKNIINKVLNMGININQVDKLGNNLLFYLVLNIYNDDNFETMKYLIDKCININHVNHKGENILFTLDEKYDISNALIDSDEETSDEEEDNKDVKLYDILKYLIDIGININQINKKGENILFNFINYYKETKLLLDYGLNINHLNKKKENILLYGVKNDIISLETIDLLIQSNIKINHHKYPNILFILINYYQRYHIPYLISKYNLLDNSINSNGETLLFSLLNKNKLWLFTYLISFNIIDINQINNKGQTILFLSIKKELNDHVIFLLSQKNIDLTIKIDNESLYDIIKAECHGYKFNEATIQYLADKIMNQK